MRKRFTIFLTIMLLVGLTMTMNWQKARRRARSFAVLLAGLALGLLSVITTPGGAGWIVGGVMVLCSASVARRVA